MKGTVESRIDFRSGIVLHSKQVYDVRVPALSEWPRDECSKEKSQTAEVKSQESGVGIIAYI